MDYRKLGRSGLKVSPLCLGTMMFGGPTDERDFGAYHRPRQGGRNQLHRHRGRLQRRPLRGDRRPGDQGRARRLGPGHQDVQSDGAGPEPARAVAALDVPGVRCLACAARHRLDRRHVPAPGGPRHAARGDRDRDGRSDPLGQGALLRRLQLPQLAARRDLQHLRPARDRPAGGEPALLQRHEPHARGRASARLRPLRPRRGALQPARPRRAHRQVRSRRAAARGHPRAAVRTCA